MNGTLGCVFAETQNPKIDVQNTIFLKPACFSRSPNRKTCFITPRSTENVGMYLLKSRTPNRCSKHRFPDATMFQQQCQQEHMLYKTEIKRNRVCVFAEIQNPKQMSKYNFPEAGLFQQKPQQKSMLYKTENNRNFVYVFVETRIPEQILKMYVFLKPACSAEDPMEKHAL